MASDSYHLIAKAVASDLTEAAQTSAFDKVFRAEFGYFDFDLPLGGMDDEDTQEEEAGTLHVDVVPGGFDSLGLESRSGARSRINTDVAIRQLIAPDQRNARGRIDLEVLRELGSLVVAICLYFADPDNHQLPDYPAAEFQGVNVLTLYEPKHLREFHQFTGLVRITHEVSDDLGD